MNHSAYQLTSLLERNFKAALGLGMKLDRSVLTWDRIWTTLGLAVDVQLIR